MHAQAVPPNRKPFKMHDRKAGLSKVLKSVWLVVCLIGLVTQNIVVTIEYFRYVTTTEVQMEIENEFVPPAFSVCFFLGDMINPNVFPSSHPCSKGISYKDPSFMQCVSNFQNNFTINEIMSRLTFNLSDTIDRLNINSKTFGDAPVESFQQYVDEYYFDYKRCIRIRYDPNPEVKVKNSEISRISNSRRVYMSVFGKSGISRWEQNYIFHYFTDPKSYPRGFEIRVHSDFGTGKCARTYDFKKVQFVYLPSPYFSECTKHYDTKEIESKDHCIEICVKQSIRRALGQNSAPQQLAITPDEWSSNPNQSFHPDFNYHRNPNNRIVNYYDQCNSQCPLGCHVNQYEPILVNSGPSMDNYSFEYRMINMGNRIKLTFIPKLDALAYFIYVASACGLWLGFAVYDLLNLRSLFKVTQHNHKLVVNVNYPGKN